MASKVKVVAKALKGAALGIIDAYLKINPQASLADLNKAFESSEIKGGKQLLFTEAELDKEVAESSSSSAAEKLADRKKQGYFVTMPDGTKISFSARLMWNKDNYPILEAIANKLGIEVASFDSCPAGAKGFYTIENASSSADSDAAEKAKAAAEKAKAEAAAAEKAKAEIEKAAIEKAKADAAKAKAEAEAAAAAKASAEVAKAKAEVERLKAEAEMAKAEAAALAKAKAEIEAAKAEAEKAKAAAAQAQAAAANIQTDDVRAVSTARTKDGHPYVDLGLPSRLKWATMNIGAEYEDDWGNYFEFGDTKVETTFGDSSRCVEGHNLQLSEDAAAQIWKGGWRMPSSLEFRELLDGCDWAWTDDYKSTGCPGLIGTSKKNQNQIFFPASGFRDSDVAANYKGQRGIYWSSYYGYESGSYYGKAFCLSKNERELKNKNRYNGHSIRPVIE